MSDISKFQFLDHFTDQHIPPMHSRDRSFQRSRFEALKSAAADHWSKIQLKWNQNSSATSTSKCSKCFNLQDVLAFEDACIEVVALADFFYTSKLKLSEGLKPKHFQMRESATEVTWSNWEISAFVDFSRPRLPAGRTSKASLRLHRHTLCTAGPHQGHRWSLLYSRKYMYISLHIPPTCLIHLSSCLAFLYRLNSIGSSTSSCAESTNFCTPICWFQRNAYANTQILASYDMWRSFAWENSEQASNSISFKFKQFQLRIWEW